jgi:G:T-mismatch repair DNA endonuclease (very short patch repair protein)
MVMVKCAWCAKDIETYPSRVKRNQANNSKFYCSKECKSAYWSTHRIGENNPKSKPKMSVKCAWCGDTIMLPSWRVKKSDRHFCNAQCKGNWSSEHRKGPSSPYYKKESHVMVKCNYCGKLYETRIQQYKRFKSHYCSKKCSDDAKRGQKSGPRAKLHECACQICGTMFYQPKNQKRQRQTCSAECGILLRARNRDKRVTLVCQYCGKQYRVHNCEKERSKYCSRSCLALGKLVDGHSDTIPEKLTAERLDALGIEYVPQYPIDRMKVDFYLPETNTVLEVYGDYWHANPQKYCSRELLTDTQRQNIIRDRKRRKYLKERGYRFKYVWESQIKENPQVLDEILSTT